MQTTAMMISRFTGLTNNKSFFQMEISIFVEVNVSSSNNSSLMGLTSFDLKINLGLNLPDLPVQPACP